MNVSTGEVTPATDAAPGIDAMWLLRLVRVRRELKLVCVLAIVAVPVWGGFTYIAETVLPRSSQTFWSIDAKIAPGFLLIIAVLVVEFLLLLVTRVLGRPGQIAAKLVPVFGRGPEPAFVGDPEPMRPMLGQLRRKGLIRVGALMMFIVFGLVSAAAGWSVWPAWLANHGRGGTVVTIGEEATISGYSTSSHGHRNYFLDEPGGTAIAEDHRPRDGERWTVLNSSVGNDKAYLVGGHDYVLIAVITLVALLAEAGIVVYQVGATRAELAARARTPGELADSVSYLSAGHSPELRVDTATRFTLTLGSLGDRSAAEWLSRRQLISASLAVLVIAAAGTALGLWRAGVFRTPPAQRDTTLTYLEGTSWASDDVFADYQNNSSTTELLRSGFQQAGITSPNVTATASVLFSSRDVPPGARSTVTAYVDIADIGSAPAGTAVHGVVLLEQSLARTEHGTVSTLTGLPADWQGVLLGKAGEEDGGVEIAGATGGKLVWISLHGTFSAVQAEQRGLELARAIAGRGVVRFCHDVARR